MEKHHIFFLIAEQHFIPTGGIGSFFRGFARMAQHFDWRVTVILDKPVRPENLDIMQTGSNVAFVVPEHPKKYAGYNPDPSQFAKEVPNPFKQANFEAALNKALLAAKPSHILINTPEAGVAVTSLGLQNRFSTTFYTHHENLVLPEVPKSNKFGPEYMQMLFDIVATDGMQTATQSHFNIERMAHLNMSSPATVLPMPIPDIELLTPYSGAKEGVLFIGRHEPRKQPAVFARKLAEAKLPAKVLTNKKGEDKFINTFEKYGVTDYEIRSEIIGKEKAGFIQSARIAFHPAKIESYGFSAMETLAAGLPTLLIHEYGWWQSFIEERVDITPIRQAKENLIQLYNKKVSPFTCRSKCSSLSLTARNAFFLSVIAAPIIKLIAAETSSKNCSEIRSPSNPNKYAAGGVNNVVKAVAVAAAGKHTQRCFFSDGPLLSHEFLPSHHLK